MNKQDAMQEIETIRARLTVLEGIVQEPEVVGLWKPDSGCRYWYLDEAAASSGTIYLASYPYDQRRSGYGNCFPSREAAEKAAPLFARAHKIIQAALQADPDAGEWSKDRQFSVADQDGRLRAGTFSNTRSFQAYVHTSEQAERMAAILNAEGVK